MTRPDEIIVDYENGMANVLIGGQKIAIARQDEDKPGYLCPIELISASLGS